MDAETAAGGQTTTCPFCAEKIRKEAIVCKHCHRDLGFIKPLAEANHALKEKVAALEAELAQLQRKAARAVAVAERAPPAPVVPPKPPGFFSYAIGYFLVPVLLLLAAHYLMVIRFDVNMIYLRAASILLPLPFGYLLFKRTGNRFPPTIAMGALVGTTAVAGMLSVVGVTDDVPIVPADARDWQEAVEYSLSIALAFLLGGLIAHSIALARAKIDDAIDAAVTRSMLGRVAKVFIEKTGLGDPQQTMSERILGLEKLMSSGTATATAAASIYAGFKALF